MWRVFGTLTACAVVAVASGAAARPQQPAPVRSAPTVDDYRFPSGAGLLFFHVRPERTEDFEAVVARLSEVLDRSEDPVRRQQAFSWRVFRSTESPRETAIYLFFFDPAVFGADYDVVTILSEAAPAEAQELYDRLLSVLVRVERMGLAKLR